jgi:hypothetical protein
MPQLQLTNDSEFYRLITGALAGSAGRYESLEVFFRDEFGENSFPAAKWKELFTVAEENETGEYTQMTGVNTFPVMASYTSFDAEGQLIANDGFKVTSKNMPRMKLALNFNEKSFRDGQKIARLGGTPEYNRVFSSFNKDASALIAGCQVLRSYTALQVESTGKYISDATNNAGGLLNLTFDFTVGQPPTNRRLAGYFGGTTKYGVKEAWSDATANPIGDLRDMYWTYKQETRVPFKGLFRMSENTLNLLLEHPTTKAAVAIWKTNGLVSADNLAQYYVTPADINEYMTSRLQLPAISAEDWHGTYQVIDPATQKIKKTPLQAFNDGVVLLRPEGFVGDLQWQSPTTLFATSSNPMYLADGGKIGVQQEIFSQRKAMHFTAESTGITVPRNIDYFLYCDVATLQ